MDSPNEISRPQVKAPLKREASKRKTPEEMQLLIHWFDQYEGKWDNKFMPLCKISGFNKRQLNKWFWDRRKKQNDIIKHKRLSYPGLIF
jgi:hypothetical protein